MDTLGIIPLLLSLFQSGTCCGCVALLTEELVILLTIINFIYLAPGKCTQALCARHCPNKSQRTQPVFKEGVIYLLNSQLQRNRWREAQAFVLISELQHHCFPHCSHTWEKSEVHTVLPKGISWWNGRRCPVDVTCSGAIWNHSCACWALHSFFKSCSRSALKN